MKKTPCKVSKITFNSTEEEEDWVTKVFQGFLESDSEVPNTEVSCSHIVVIDNLLQRLFVK